MVVLRSWRTCGWYVYVRCADLEIPTVKADTLRWKKHLAWRVCVTIGGLRGRAGDSSPSFAPRTGHERQRDDEWVILPVLRPDQSENKQQGPQTYCSIYSCPWCSATRFHSFPKYL